MSKLMMSFIFKGCMNPVTSTNLELVDQFCYLGVMLSVDADDDAAVEARI